MDSAKNSTTRIVQPQVDCNSAEEFLDAIAPWGQYFRQFSIDECWLFRGQERDWDVLPSLFRNDNATVENLSKLTHRNIGKWGQELIEAELLVEFFSIADSRGLILPGDSQGLRDFLADLKSRIARSGDGAIFPDEYYDKLLPLAALAQHYGIPTQLLDWTKKVFIAAFFAAKSIPSNNENPDERFVVWAFRFPLLGMQSYFSNDAIRVVTAPGSTNPNLQAQQGVFTALHNIYVRRYQGEKGVYPPFNKYLEYRESDDSLCGCILRKFTLPRNQAKNLLHLLAKLDIQIQRFILAITVLLTIYE